MARKAGTTRTGARSQGHRKMRRRIGAGKRRSKPASTTRKGARATTRPSARKKTATARKVRRHGTRPSRPTRARTVKAGRGGVGSTPERKPRSQAPVTKTLPDRSAPAPPAGVSERRPRVAPALLRERRTLQEDESRYLGAALTGQEELVERLLEHTETGPTLTAGDLDGDWEHAYSSGDEAPGGDNPTPDQADVGDIGRALGIHYADDEELKLGDKEAERDRHRWELDPASAEDYRVREEEE